MLRYELDFIQVKIWNVFQRIERVYGNGRSAYETVADVGSEHLPPKYPVTLTH